MDVVHAWSQGASFAQVFELTTIMEGTIIRWVGWLTTTDATD